MDETLPITTRRQGSNQPKGQAECVENDGYVSVLMKPLENRVTCNPGTRGRTSPCVP